MSVFASHASHPFNPTGTYSWLWPPRVNLKLLPEASFASIPCCRYSFGVMMWELCHGMLAWNQVGGLDLWRGKGGLPPGGGRDLTIGLEGEGRPVDW